MRDKISLEKMLGWLWPRRAVAGPTPAEPPSALQVANEILAVARPRRLDAMGLNKLVYLAHGRWIEKTGAPIADERPAVWTHGPVFASVHAATRRYGMTPLPYVLEDAHGKISWLGCQDPRRDMIAAVVKAYADYSSAQLSTICHTEGSAWQIYAMAHGYKVPARATLPDALVGLCFKRDPTAGYRALCREA